MTAKQTAIEKINPEQQVIDFALCHLGEVCKDTSDLAVEMAGEKLHPEDYSWNCNKHIVEVRKWIKQHLAYIADGLKSIEAVEKQLYVKGG